ncbi:PDR/VanB family oxidoreductase [Streptomyces sp. NPDC050625]|uniref:PDR/VanB family oxidoreductase n=1 Tax=Streptomyces sp. NPDC050625 TaxID=3154629 RepID=UPI00343B38F9
MVNNADQSQIKLRLRDRVDVARDVVRLEFEAVGGEELPAWEPGAHLDMFLPSGISRQYSLCGDPGDTSTYAVAVLREPAGRGGSEEIHRDFTPGVEILSRRPRNHFELVDAPDYVLVAGGIGVTPIKAMAEELERRGASWRLVYGGRSRESMAFADQLAAFAPERVTLVPQDTDGLPDIAGIVGGLSPEGVIYCCGPAPLLDAVAAACETAGVADRLHIERFSAPTDAPEIDTSGDFAFDVELRASGVTLHIAADQSILEAVQEIRPDIASSCLEGYCGSCETDVIEGQPDHRGTLMSPEEHDEEGTMLICVGRAKCSKLVLDL